MYTTTAVLHTLTADGTLHSESVVVMLQPDDHTSKAEVLITTDWTLLSDYALDLVNSAGPRISTRFPASFLRGKWQVVWPTTYHGRLYALEHSGQLERGVPVVMNAIERMNRDIERAQRHLREVNQLRTPVLESSFRLEW